MRLLILNVGSGSVVKFIWGVFLLQRSSTVQRSTLMLYLVSGSKPSKVNDSLFWKKFYEDYDTLNNTYMIHTSDTFLFSILWLFEERNTLYSLVSGASSLMSNVIFDCVISFDMRPFTGLTSKNKHQWILLSRNQVMHYKDLLTWFIYFSKNFMLAFFQDIFIFDVDLKITKAKYIYLVIFTVYVTNNKQ